MTINKTLILLAHAFVGWALCAATMGIGMAVTTLDHTLIIHAIGAPIFFCGVSFVYFLTFVVAMDFFLVAMLINHSFEMFTSILGTWLPFALIFTSTYLTGYFITGSKKLMV